MKTKFKLTYILVFLCSSCFAQLKDYTYKSKLNGIQNQWHKIILPNEVLGKLSPDLSDLRVYGITKAKDTIEAPYILQLAADKITDKERSFKLINQSKKNKGYYFTFEVPAENEANQIQLEFKEQNFDWRLTLEGSQNQQEWFSIIEDYRILSIKNGLTDFQFTKLSFPNSRYRYFRLLVSSNKKPELLSAKIALKEIIAGDYKNYKILSTTITNDKQYKQTLINMDLESPVPVSKLKIYVQNKFDYYRPITIEYLSDSFKTQQGWKYNYSTLSSGTLNSLEKTDFTFNSTLLKKIKIVIDNADNQPLQIDSVAVSGYVHELVARFNEPATYFLAYGNTGAGKPNYDIDRFVGKIPTTITALQLSEEQLIDKDALKKTIPLFQNKKWLWVIMSVIIILLGWFSIKMIRQK